MAGGARAAGAERGLRPVIIVPGDASNQLEARVRKPRVVRPWCTRDSGGKWFRLWLNLASLLAPPELPCWADNMRLEFDPSTQRSHNAAGVETRIVGWGDTASLESLDPALPFPSAATWRPLVQALVDDLGYERNVSVRAAPYDFRYSPLSDGARYFRALEALVNATSDAHGGARVVLVAHSLGCKLAQRFLGTRSREWRRARIEHFVAIAGAFGGSAKLLRLHGSGDAEGLPLPPLQLRAEQRSSESNVWMLPHAEVFGDAPLARTPARNYTAAQAADFLRAVGYADGALLLAELAPLRRAFAEPPGVRTSCLSSRGVPTPAAFTWHAGPRAFDAPPAVALGDGDGAVNAQSLGVCETWAGAQPEPVHSARFEGVAHADMITDKAVIKHVASILAPTGSRAAARGRREWPRASGPY